MSQLSKNNTETKAYSLGAERAAREVVPIYSDQATRADETERVANLISRETCDREMLEALKLATDWIEALWGEGVATKNEFSRAERFVANSKALIAKVEGR